MKWILYIVGGIVAVLVLLMVFGWSMSRDNADGTWSDTMARTVCEEGVKLSAKNPSSVEIPFTRASRQGDEITYAWKHGDGLRMQNGFGAMIDTEMYCIADVRQKKIVWIASTPRP